MAAMHSHGRPNRPHSHEHSHEHGHARGAITPAFKWAAIVNTVYLVGEAAAGVAFGSVALLADAAHNLSDVAGLLIAWGAAVAARRKPTARYNFGFGRATILAALFNGVTIFAGALAVIVESALRFQNPTPIPALSVMGVALVGIAINAGSALLFRDERHDLNADGAYLHMMADAAVSGGVVLAAAVAGLTGWNWLDPFAAVVVSLIVAWAAWGLTREAVRLAMDGAPPRVDRAAVADHLRALPGVAEVRDLRLWALSTTATALSARLVMPGGHPGDAFLKAAAHDLDHAFGIEIALLQVSLGDGAPSATRRPYG